MKKIIIFAMKMNSPAVFNSHWSCVAVAQLLLFLIDSTDQSDTDDPTVF